MINTSLVVEHYDRHAVMERLRALFDANAPGEAPVSVDELSAVDQLHARGLAATVELAAAARVDRQALVLDIGSGLGGPSRYLAGVYGCRVMGVDLTPSFVEASTYLASRAGLADRLVYAAKMRSGSPSKTAATTWSGHNTSP